MKGQVISFFLIVLLSAGCVNLGPRYRRPDLGFRPPDRYEGAQGGLPAPEERWWRAFGDPKVDELVKRVLQANWDLRGEEARISALEASLVSTRADRLPRFDLEATTSRARTTTVIPFPRPQEKTLITDSYDLTFLASFELDIWGRLAKAEEAERHRLLAEEETRRALAQSLISEAISLYFRARALKRRVSVAEEKLKVKEETLRIVEGRHLRGLLPLARVKAERRDVEAVKVALSSLREELDGVSRQISLLLGEYPHPFPVDPLPRGAVRHLEPVPPGLPSELLLRRPDLRAAEEGLKALTAEVGVARAARFPRISLTGSYGYSSEDLETLFRPSSLLWRLAAGMTAPIFQWGKLKASERAAYSRLREAEASYAKAVLQAFYEVETALKRREELLRRRLSLEKSLQEALQLEEMAQGRWRRGLSDYLEVLEAREARLGAEEELLLLDLAILTNRVSLHRALGGGWPKSLGKGSK